MNFDVIESEVNATPAMASKLILSVLVVALVACSNLYEIVPRDNLFNTETPETLGPSIKNNQDSNDDKTKSFPKVWKVETTDSYNLTSQTDYRDLVKTIDTPCTWKVAPVSAADFNPNACLDVDVRVPYNWDVDLSSVSYFMENSVTMFTFSLSDKSGGYINMKYSNIAGEGSHDPIILELDRMAPVTGYVSNRTFRYLFTVRQVTSVNHAYRGSNALWFVRLG